MFLYAANKDFLFNRQNLQRELREVVGEFFSTPEAQRASAEVIYARDLPNTWKPADGWRKKEKRGGDGADAGGGAAAP